MVQSVKKLPKKNKFHKFRGCKYFSPMHPIRGDFQVNNIKFRGGNSFEALKFSGSHCIDAFQLTIEQWQQNPEMTFHCTGWFMGFLMVYYNPLITWVV